MKPTDLAHLPLAICALALVLAGLAHAGGRGLTDTSQSPHAALTPVDLGDARWTRGLWAEKFELCRSVMLSGIEDALQDPANSEQLKNLRLAAGLEEGERHGTDWSDGDCYKWLEAMSLVYAVTGDAELDRKLDEWIDVIAKAQTPAGYLSTNIGSNPDDWLPEPYRHELYNMGHLIHAGCIHHRATGKDTFLAIARRTADFLYERFSPRPPELVHFPWNPSVYMGLIELYRTTREARYLELAELMIGNRGSSPGGGDHRNGGTDQTQDRVPIRQETDAVGHAVCATYLYCGAADLLAETGDPELRAALERIWESVAFRRSYITGGVGPGSGTSERGDPVHEAFHGDYVLPNRSAYAETCANIGAGMFGWRMFAATGEARYADMWERMVYNSLLGSVSADGLGYFYANPLRWTGEEKGPHNHHTATRWRINDCYCCPPQVARTIAGLHSLAYGTFDGAVWVNLYGASTLDTELPDGTPVGLQQETDYPWDGRVTVTVTNAPAEPFELKLRAPGWATGATLQVNGEPADEPATPGAYVSLRRNWSVGDTVVLDLPMEPRLMQAHPEVDGIQDWVAVMRGPVVYCLELPTASGGEATWRKGVFFPENIELTPRHQPELLGGVTVLTGQALTFAGRDRFLEQTAAAEPPPPVEWEGLLYQPLTPRELPVPDGETVDVTLIPYFAWANRGISFMEVWIPLARRTE